MSASITSIISIIDWSVFVSTACNVHSTQMHLLKMKLTTASLSVFCWFSSTKTTAVQCDTFLPVDLAGIFLTISELTETTLLHNGIRFCWFTCLTGTYILLKLLLFPIICLLCCFANSVSTYYASTFMTGAWFIFFRKNDNLKNKLFSFIKTQTHTT